MRPSGLQPIPPFGDTALGGGQFQRAVGGYTASLMCRRISPANASLGARELLHDSRMRPSYGIFACDEMGIYSTTTILGRTRRNGFDSRVFAPLFTACVMSSLYGAPMKPPAKAPFTVTAADDSPFVPSQTK